MYVAEGDAGGKIDKSNTTRRKVNPTPERRKPILENSNNENMMKNDGRPGISMSAECVACELPLIHVLTTTSGGLVMICGNCNFLTKVSLDVVTPEKEEE